VNDIKKFRRMSCKLRDRRSEKGEEAAERKKTKITRREHRGKGKKTRKGRNKIRRIEETGRKSLQFVIFDLLLNY
jgi:hypothetical protein